MYVSRLVLQDFRIYRSLALELPQGVTLFYGSNAAGKTTLLEALFYLATTRSPRATTDRELVNFEATGDLGIAPFARMATLVHANPAREPLNLEIIIQRRYAANGDLLPTSQKTIRIDKINRRAIDLIGQLRVVMFAPQDLRLVTGPPADRRRYLDVTLSQIDHGYVRALSRYNQVLAQRNSLLRVWREKRRRSGDDILFWDEELTKAGTRVLRERRRAVAELSTLVQRIYTEITGSDLSLSLEYVNSTNAEDVAGFMDALKDQRREEVDRGVTTIGPHRDDLSILLDKREIGMYGSRGQQRATTLALRLAEAELMQARTGDAPMLLLDDLLSELDRRRREHLMAVLVRPNQQALITATDMDDFSPAFLKQITRMHVEQGHVFPT